MTGTGGRRGAARETGPLRPSGWPAGPAASIGWALQRRRVRLAVLAGAGRSGARSGGEGGKKGLRVKQDCEGELKNKEAKGI